MRNQERKNLQMKRKFCGAEREKNNWRRTEAVPAVKLGKKKGKKMCNARREKGKEKKITYGSAWSAAHTHTHTQTGSHP